MPTGNQSFIPMFNGENYEFWSIKMKTLFISQDIWDLVCHGYVEPAVEEIARLTGAQKTELKENRKKDAKALLIIQQAVTDAIFPRISTATQSKEAWELLKSEYQGTDKVITVKLQTLRRDFETLSMKKSESLQVFFTRTIAVVNQIRSLGEVLIDQKVVEKILRSLTPKFDHVVAAIEVSVDLSTYSLKELMGCLQAHEQRLNRTTENGLEHAFTSKLDVAKEEAGQSKFAGAFRGRGGFRGRGRGRGRSGFGGRSNDDGKKAAYDGRGNCYSHIQCRHCKKFGHIERNCWEKAKEQANVAEGKEKQT